MKVEDPYKLNQQILKAVQGISDKFQIIVDAVNEVGMRAKKDIKDANKSLDKTKTKVRDIADASSDIYKNLQLNKIVKAVDRVKTDVLNISRNMQTKIGKDLKAYEKLTYNLAASARDINNTIGKGIFSTADFLKAATKLAEIGWSDLQSLSQVTPALAKIERAVGTTTTAFSNTIMQLQKVFKTGTADLVKALGNSLVAYSELFGMTTAQVEDAINKVSSNLTTMSGGDQDKYQKLMNEALSAVALATKTGTSSTGDRMTILISEALNDSVDEFSKKYATSLGALEISSVEFQRQIQSGNMVAAVESLMNAVSQKGTGEDANIYKNLISGLGFSDIDVQTMANNIQNIDSYMSEIASANLDSLEERLDNGIISIGESFRNSFSSNAFITGISNAMASIGISSVSDLLIGIMALVKLISISGKSDDVKNAITKVLGIVKKDTISGDIKNMFSNSSNNNLMWGSGVSNYSSGYTTNNAPDMKSTGFANIFKAGAKLAVVAIALAAAMKVIQKVLEKDSVKKAVARLMEAVQTIGDILDSILDIVADAVAGVVNIIIDFVLKIIDGVKPIISLLADVIQKIIPVVSELITQIIHAAEDLVQPLMDTLTTLFEFINAAINIITPIINTVLSMIISVIKLINPVLNIIIKVLSSIGKIVGGVIFKSINNIADVFEMITSVLEPIFGLITSLFDQVTEILDAVSVTIDDIFEAIQPIFEVLIEVIGSILSPLTSILKAVLPLVLDLMDPFITTIKKLSGVFKFVKPVVEWLSSVVKSISDGINNFINWLANLHIGKWYPFGSLKNTSGEETKSAGGYTYGFGMNGQGFHVGQDIPMASGTPLAPSQVGVITGTGYNDTYGNWVSMVNTAGVQEVFGHLSSISAKTGETIMPGEVFGTSGNTGNSEFPHLHIENRENGRFVDPFIVNKSNNADVVAAIAKMTERLENKLEEVSYQTGKNTEWIEAFDKKNRSYRTVGL